LHSTVVKQQLLHMKKKSQFEKFFHKKSNAAVKEEFRQEKKKWKKEREEFFEKKRSQKSEVRSQKSEVGNQTSDVRHQTSDLMPLNKFIAHCGVCSRRDAADMVKLGKVKVNGQVITEPGHKVSGKDDIRVAGKKVLLAKNLVYILLNKPKDFITTTDDPQGRKTVLDLIKRATNERVYPVGRLDRNTSGVLLLTNDGELSQKLTHPSNEIKKIYAVTLDKPLDKKDFDQILKGVTLEDGPAAVDKLAFTDTKDKTQIGVELHSGRNRIVRRIFEGLGYDVKQLDRVMFAGLTKKNVERGKWRYLNEREVRELKYFGKGK
jgi:23S rRNA pseudouridine2605 synthase